MLNFTFFSFKLHGATYYSVSNGNWTGSIWNSSTTTGTGSPLPTLVDGDEIIIDDQVTISSGTINISANIKIFIRTTSTSNPAKLIFVTGGKLVLSNSSSTIKLENTTGNASFNPQIDGSGSGSSNQITIGSNEVWRASNGDIQGIGTLTTNSNNGVLPVELLFFKIDEEQINLLHWATATQLNFSHFEVEHSANGETWSKIGEVEGAGNTNEYLAYSFLNQNPFNGNNYYRLRMVDLDETFEYSTIIKSVSNQGLSLQIYPNPVIEHIITLSYNFEVTSTDVLSLLDLSGNMVWQGVATNFTGKIELPQTLMPGTYFLQFTSADKNFATTKRLVIK